MHRHLKTGALDEPLAVDDVLDEAVTATGLTVSVRMSDVENASVTFLWKSAIC